jgi:hypothetical protein
MPFELGLVLGMNETDHKWFLFESVNHRVSRPLSDLAGYDAGIHHGTPEGILRAVANAFGARRRHVAHGDLVTLWKALRGVARRIQRDRGTLFAHAAFVDLVVSGQELAQAHFTRTRD